MFPFSISISAAKKQQVGSHKAGHSIRSPNWAKQKSLGCDCSKLKSKTHRKGGNANPLKLFCPHSPPPYN